MQSGIENCRTKRGLKHCGECAAFPCKKLRDFSLKDGGKLLAEYTALREAGKRVESLLTDEKFGGIDENKRAFAVAFDKTLVNAGFESSGIVPYLVFGKYKIEYSKSGLKNKNYIARFYIGDKDILLRLYFSDIDKHREYVERAPDFIKNPFVNDTGKCRGCDGSGGGIGKKGKCSFKKSFTINGVLYEKCAGENFYFNNYDINNISKYVDLLTVFYPAKINWNC